MQQEDLAQFYYLSTASKEIQRAEFDRLDRSSSVIPQAYKSQFDFYVSYYATYQVFPTWVKFLQSYQLTCSPEEESAIKSIAPNVYHTRMTVWETDNLVSSFQSQTPEQRVETVAKLQAVLSIQDTKQESVISSTSTFGLEQFVVKSDEDQVKYKFPIKALNQSVGSLVQPGYIITVVASPGMFKTSFALNFVYLNSIMGPKKSLYIYLENTERAYQANLLSRFSYDVGTMVANKSLKSGILETDTGALKAVRELKEKFDSEKQGEVYFVPYSRFSNEPSKFATQVAALVTSLEIDVLVLDHVNKTKDLTPAKMTQMEYMNRIFGVLTSISLGMYNNRKCVTMVLAQQNREAEQRTLRTRGKMTRYDVAEIAKAEQDSFLMIGLFADEEMKAAHQMVYQTLKNRDELGDISPVQTTVIPEYCYVGDMSSSVQDDIYNQDAFDSVFEDL